METLFATFNKKVEEGYYPPMPELNEIDISLLKEEVNASVLNEII